MYSVHAESRKVGDSISLFFGVQWGVRVKEFLQELLPSPELSYWSAERSLDWLLPVVSQLVSNAVLSRSEMIHKPNFSQQSAKWFLHFQSILQNL